MKSNFYTSGIIAAFLLLISHFQLFAQWTSDPNHPTVVCNENGDENTVKAFADGSGGVFVFWLDGRNLTSTGIHQIYGQHYDENGYALWENSGRLIINHVKQINFYDVQRFDNGDIIIGWATSSPSQNGVDSLLFQKLNSDGGKIWAQDLLVATKTSVMLGFTGFDLIYNNNSYVVDIQLNYMGGSNGNRITYFNSDGALTGPLNGYPMGTQYYFGSAHILQAYNGSDDIYLYYSGGNGSGAGLFCMRISMAGDTVWGPVNVLEGTTGLSYQFKAFSDPDGVVFIWQGNKAGSPNLYARRYNSTGSMVWGQTPLPICEADGQQGYFFCRKLDNMFYIVWADGRTGTNPGFYDIYGQKFDESGNIYWDTDGKKLASFNTYIPYPDFAFTNDNDLIVCHQSTTVGFNAQKVKQNGDLPWAPDGTQICITNYNPFYEQHVELLTGNTMVAAWASSGSNGANGIYISKINQYLTGTDELKSSSSNCYPNPSHDYIYIQANALSDPESARIISSTGTVYSLKGRYSLSGNGSLKINIEDLPAGRYILNSADKNAKLSEGFVKLDK